MLDVGCKCEGWMMVKHCHVVNMAGLTPEGGSGSLLDRRESNRCWTQNSDGRFKLTAQVRGVGSWSGKEGSLIHTGHSEKGALTWGFTEHYGHIFSGPYFSSCLHNKYILLSCAILFTLEGGNTLNLKSSGMRLPYFLLFLRETYTQYDNNKQHCSIILTCLASKTEGRHSILFRVTYLGAWNIPGKF
jgi:hypothetical protein